MGVAGRERERFEAGWRWQGFEVAFRDLRGQDWPFTLRGRIDRLDYNPETADLVVWDYKSGEIPKKNQVLDEVAEAQLPCYLLAVEQGRVPVNPAAASLRAGFIGLKSPRSHHLKHEDFAATPEKWREAAAAFAGEGHGPGPPPGRGGFPSRPHPGPGEAPRRGLPILPLRAGLRLCPGAGRGRGIVVMCEPARDCHDQGFRKQHGLKSNQKLGQWELKVPL